MPHAGDDLGRELAKLRREVDTLKAAMRRRSLGLSSLDGATLTVKNTEGIATGALGTKTGDIVSDAMTARSANYDADGSEGGTQGWLIDRDGNADFRDVNFRGVSSGESASYNAISANESLVYRGTELADLLDSRPRGIVAWGQHSVYAREGLDITVGRLDVSVTAGRSYRIHTTDLSNAIAGRSGELVVKYTTDGSEPTLSSPSLTIAFRSYQFNSNKIVALWNATTTGVLKLLFYVDSNFNDIIRVEHYGDLQWMFWAEDIGATPPKNGTDPGGGGPPPVQKVWKTFDVQPYASRSYTGGGQPVNGGEYDNQYCMQGDIGIDGNRRSWMWFDANAQGLGSKGSMNDLQGVARADLQYFEVWLNYPHWAFASGGMAFVGCHNSNIVTATEQGGALYGRKQEWYPGRNIGKWVNLMDTDIMWEALAGRLEGIVLGNTGSNSLDHYGYAWGANGVNGQQPGLRAGYWK